MSITCGIDWAESHHDLVVMDDTSMVLARRRIDTSVKGFGKLMGLLAEHTDEPRSVRWRSRQTRT